VSDGIRDSIVERGFAGPVPILSKDECAAVLAHEASGKAVPGLDWMKGRAASDPFYARLATDPRIIALLQPVLGNDIVLWGVDVLRRKPDQVHPWHCDIESCAAEGGFLSVWIGIENTSRDSALNCVSRSHRFGSTLQETAHARGLKRGEADAGMVLAWARARDGAAEIEAPDVRDGEAIIFDGRLWHGTHNTRPEGTRTALLLQYAAANCPVRMIDFTLLEWPFTFIAEPRPPVIAVSGSVDPGINRIVAAPCPT